MTSTGTSVARATAVVHALTLALVLASPGTGLARPLTRVGTPAASSARSSAASGADRAAYGELPLGFTDDGRGGFVARGIRHGLALSNGEAVLAGPSGAIRLRFGPASAVRLEEPLPGVANYFLGKDPSMWRTNVRTFARVRFVGVAPGVDLVFYGTQERPEYDFVVAPGADPATAVAVIERARTLEVTGDGDLAIVTTDGVTATQPRPSIYQETAAGRRLIAGGYAVDGAAVRVDVAAYDRSLPLVIDPVLAFATYLGGNGDDRVERAVSDASGNLYVVGSTLSSNFPTTAPLQPNQSGMDAFVSKINSSGTALLFSTYIGGSGTDFFNDVAIDGAHVYLGGATGSENYPTVNAYSGNLINDGLDAVLTVLNLAGSAITYSTMIGGGNNDIGNGVAVDVHGNAYLAGESLDTGGIFSRNFPTKSPSSLPPFQDDFAGGRSDGFVAKFDPDESGNASLVYSTLIGGSEGEGVEAIVVDDNERAYVCGYTESTNFPRQSALQNTYGGGTDDAFITKFNADGTTVFYSTFYGGTAIDEPFSIALDESSGASLPVVVGHSTSSNLRTQLPVQPSKNGPEDCFVLKLNDSGGTLVYATYFGGPGNDSAKSVVTDAAGNAYFTGFSNNSYPLLNPIPVNGSINTTGATMTKLSPAGQLLLSTCVSSGSGEGIGVDATGNVYVAGTTSLTNFPVTAGALQQSFGGTPNDCFAFKLDLVDDDTVGVFKSGTQQFQLRNSNSGGAADLTFTFGAAGDRAIRGDWDGDGVDTIGTYTPATGTFSLRNSNSAGAPFATFTFGAPNLQPIVGDWNGDGVDSIGVFDTATGSYFLRNANSAGAADFAFTFGTGGQGAIAVAGDWNGDNVDTIGFFVLSSKTFFLRNQNAGGNADLQFVFGGTSGTPLAGDWNGDGVDTIGFYTPGFITFASSTFQLRNSNSAGPADLTVNFGVRGDAPVVGNWDGQ
jgi:hypothetical protein